LIEGAAEGAGLGVQFLKHVQRNRLLLHVVDMAPMFDDEADAVAHIVSEIRTIEQEMARFDAELLGRPRWLLLNKGDLLDTEVRNQRAQAVLAALNWQSPWFLISALAHEGTWVVAQKVMAFFDSQKAAAVREVEEARPWSPLD